MRRRKYLATVGASAVGYTGTASASTQEAPTIWSIELASEATIPISDVESKIWVVHPETTPEDPAEVGLRITNNRNEKLELGFNAPKSVNRIVGERARGDVKALLVGRLNWLKKNGEMWRMSDQQLSPDQPDQLRTAVLEPNQEYRNQFELWAHPGSPLLPPGEYTFTRELPLQDTSEKFEFALRVSH